MPRKKRSEKSTIKVRIILALLEGKKSTTQLSEELYGSKAHYDRLSKDLKELKDENAIESRKQHKKTTPGPKGHIHSLVENISAFKNVFELLGSRHAIEFIRSPYAQKMINSELLREIEKVWALKGHFDKPPLEKEVLEVLRLSPTALDKTLQGPRDLPEIPSYVWADVSSEHFYGMLLSSLILDFSTHSLQGRCELVGKIGIDLGRYNQRNLREKPIVERLLHVERSFRFCYHPPPWLVDGNTEAGGREVGVAGGDRANENRGQATGLGRAEEIPREVQRGGSTSIE